MTGDSENTNPEGKQTCRNRMADRAVPDDQNRRTLDVVDRLDERRPGCDPVRLCIPGSLALEFDKVGQPALHRQKHRNDPLGYGNVVSAAPRGNDDARWHMWDERLDAGERRLDHAKCW